MSYIIPRDIPKGCEHCPFNGHTKCRIMPIGFDEYPLVGRRPDWCPLIEIPPHGRLIDADELKSKFRHGNGDDDADVYLSKAWRCQEIVMNVKYGLNALMRNLISI